MFFTRIYASLDGFKIEADTVGCLLLLILTLFVAVWAVCVVTTNTWFYQRKCRYEGSAKRTLPSAMQISPRPEDVRLIWNG